MQGDQSMRVERSQGPRSSYRPECPFPVIGADLACPARGISEMRLSGFGRSIHLDVGGLDHRPPFCNFGLVPGAERFGRELVLWRHLQAEIFGLLADRRVVQGIDRRGI